MGGVHLAGLAAVGSRGIGVSEPLQSGIDQFV
jgi:hypothetical protein